MEKVNLGIFGYPLYDVYENGCVWSCKTGRFLIPQKGWNGYLHVSLSSYGVTETLRVHTLVGHAFNGGYYQDKYHCHHKDGDIYNNHRNNLEWLSPKDHIEAGFELGQNTCKYTSSKFEEVSKYLGKGISDEEIALNTGVGVWTVSLFRRGRYISRESDKVKVKPKFYKDILRDEQVKQVITLLSQGLRDFEIAKVIGIDRKKVNRIRKSETFREYKRDLLECATDKVVNARLTKEDVFMILKLKDSGLWIAEIRDKTGITYDKIKTVVRGTAYKKFIDEYIALADKLACEDGAECKSLKEGGCQ